MLTFAATSCVREAAKRSARLGGLRRRCARLYYQHGAAQSGRPATWQVVDLRSDTVTKPGPAMRQAMGAAEVGDDVMGEDPTVNELQEVAAEMFGMEAALFVPSGTMGNLIAVMVHCRERGDEVIVGDLSHLHIYEQGGSAQLAGVHSTTVSNLPDGTFDLDQLDFISRALRCRKALGGGMRQAGILAAAGRLALTEMVDRLVDDHRNAKTFAQALLDCEPSLFEVDLASVETNILRFRLRQPGLSPADFCERMARVGEAEEASLGQGVRVLMYPYVGGSVRAVWHLGVSAEDTQLAIRKLWLVAKEASGE
ncbi:hypothetical protein CRUP_033299 [Coryphaenoides rupestris]|nr:hypothetical protein CRUP_033299 [Coryphaenoides rupestris]